MSGRWGVRLATAAVASLALFEGLATPLPKQLPDYALGSEWVLRGERSLAILIVLVILLTIVWRGIIVGQIPQEFSREGFKYEGAADLIEKGTAPVRDAVDRAIHELRGDLKKLRMAIETTAAASSDGIRQIEARIEKIEEQLNE